MIIIIKMIIMITIIFFHYIAANIVVLCNVIFSLLIRHVMLVKVILAITKVCVQIKSEIHQGSFASVLMDTQEDGVKQVGDTKLFFR